MQRHARAYPGRLPGGERRRVVVARALVNRPALLLADGPTGALDTASGHDVRDLLMDLHRAGRTIVLVTHDLTPADACASRTVHLVDGRVALDPRGQATRPTPRCDASRFTGGSLIRVIRCDGSGAGFGGGRAPRVVFSESNELR